MTELGLLKAQTLKWEETSSEREKTALANSKLCLGLTPLSLSRGCGHIFIQVSVVRAGG